jgi:hypothetical protein
MKPIHRQDVSMAVQRIVLRGRTLLTVFEDIGGFVFHGSPRRFDVVKPHQSYSLDRAGGEVAADGPAAIAATTEADIAIFCALVSTKRRDLGPCRTGFNRGGSDPQFRATSNLLDAARREDAIGYVYVLRRSWFLPHRGSEFRTTQPIVPHAVVSVRSCDLPPAIRIIGMEER